LAKRFVIDEKLPNVVKVPFAISNPVSELLVIANIPNTLPSGLIARTLASSSDAKLRKD